MSGIPERDGIEMLETAVKREYRIVAREGVTKGRWFLLADWNVHPPETEIPDATHVVVAVHPENEAYVRELLMLTRLMLR